MANIKKQITDLIGNTPLVEVSNLSASKGLKKPVIAKVETFNPGGSVKDRIAQSMIEAAEKSGQLKPGATFIEPTSGKDGMKGAIKAAEIAKRPGNEGKTIVTLFPDTGERYLSTMLYAFEEYPL